MKVVVTIKQVPDPDVPPGSFRIDGNKMVPPSGVSPVMNGYDANALEAALKLKEAHGGTVTALSFGPPEARDALKRAIALGADDAVLVADETSGTADGWVTSNALAAAIKRIGGVDLVLCGRQASDTDAAQVPLGLAELLELPAVAPVQRIEVAGATLRVERLSEDGHQVVEVDTPALLAVSSEIGEPRYPPLRGVMMAGRAQIPVWTLADLGVTTTPLLTVGRLYTESRESAVELIEADSPAAAGRALADRLREAKLI